MEVFRSRLESAVGALSLKFFQKLVTGLIAWDFADDARFQVSEEAGMYIAIEGLKGAGKGTLLQRLPERLREYGLNPQLLCPTQPLPADHPLEVLARQHPECDSLQEQLYAARSNHHAANARGHEGLIIGDRCILTSYATRWSRVPAGKHPEFIRRVNALEHVIGLPDHVLFLQIPPERLLERLQARTERTYGKTDETPERLQETLDAYRAMREQAGSLGLGSIVWHDIDADAHPNMTLGKC